MKVSIFTDASIRFKNCGYAFYIGCKIGKLQKAGKLKIHTSDIGIAELHCIANAVYTLKYSKFKSIDKVFIYSDSLHSVNALNGEAFFSDPEKRKIVDEIHFLMMDICVNNGKTIRDINTFFEISHIKAHTNQNDIFSKINDWCDKNARLYSKSILPKKLKKSA